MIAAIVILAALVSLYLFLICPSLEKGDDSFLAEWSFAHRGLHHQQGNAPENSMEAFRLAIEHGYGIELDVHLTKDGVAVVHHDGDLQRICQQNVWIREVTYEELCRYTLPDGSRIPRFTDVLQLVDGWVPLIVEIKRESGAVACAAKALQILKGYSGPFCVESFDPRAMGYFRRYAPEIIRGQLASGGNYEKGNWFRYFSMKYLLGNFISRPHFIAMNIHKDSSLSFAFSTKLLGCRRVGWTVRSSQEADECRRKGYSTLIFEHFLIKKLI